MKLYCIDTGSKGNCYILENTKGRKLMLECGLPVRDITSHKSFTSWGDIDAVLVTHEHKDHSLSMEKLEDYGLNIISYINTNNRQLIKIGDWKIIAFEGKHDCKVLGFIILDTIEGKSVAYATDTVSLPILPNINYWLVECNYDREFVENELLRLVTADGQDRSYYFHQLMDRHLSIQYLAEYFSKDKISKPDKIITCHLGNCFWKTIEKHLKDYDLEIAKKGGVYSL